MTKYYARFVHLDKYDDANDVLGDWETVKADSPSLAAAQLVREEDKFEGYDCANGERRFVDVREFATAEDDVFVRFTVLGSITPEYIATDYEEGDEE